MGGRDGGREGGREVRNEGERERERGREETRELGKVKRRGEEERVGSFSFTPTQATSSFKRSEVCPGNEDTNFIGIH